MGHSSIENQKVPLLIEALAEENVVYVACEGSTSAAITGKNSDICIFFLRVSVFCPLHTRICVLNAPQIK